MEVTINRFWSIEDDEGMSRASILVKRPRVDWQVAYLVFDFIYANILAPKKLMQRGNYAFTLYFDTIRSTHKYFYNSVYNTDTAKFHPAFRDRKYKGIATKEISIFCSSNTFNELITPIEYANLVYDMFGSYLVESSKKITKSELDSIKLKMDVKAINQFPFPASFDAQKYSGDSGGVEKRVVNFVVDETSEAFMFRDKYLEHYEF
ncbi:hypothetical protein BBI01_01415 [Chryseobacterium artocarpi]|uniref:Uncharacterized protein n=1 Tax=Chryseobacterium artocarpi TaxID=1414727 RepID=A0A1B8ZZX1_9FLAO|nr:hypothetical protein [Chryseobacterium artocarpi]OCA77149.1 hypothetical protein BBI01_01415 [Chryseobacterium artocarpi]